MEFFSEKYGISAFHGNLEAWNLVTSLVGNLLEWQGFLRLVLSVLSFLLVFPGKKVSE